MIFYLILLTKRDIHLDRFCLNKLFFFLVFFRREEEMCTDIEILSMNAKYSLSSKLEIEE